MFFVKFIYLFNIYLFLRYLVNCRTETAALINEKFGWDLDGSDIHCVSQWFYDGPHIRGGGFI